MPHHFGHLLRATLRRSIRPSTRRGSRLTPSVKLNIGEDGLNAGEARSMTPVGRAGCPEATTLCAVKSALDHRLTAQ